MKPYLIKIIPVIALVMGLAWILTNSLHPGSEPPASADSPAADNRVSNQAALFSTRQPGQENSTDNPIPNDSHGLKAAEPQAGSRQLSISDTRTESPEGEGAYSISGIVVDETGYGVPGMEVTAFAKKLFLAGGDGETQKKPGELNTLSGPDGFYEFRGIEDGEYRLATLPDDYYEAAQAVVRAGADSADLVLRARHPEVMVFGTVRSEGEPLDGVQASVIGQSGGSVETGMDGFYELKLKAGGNKPGYSIQFVREGFRETRSKVMVADMTGRKDIRVDAELEAQQDLVEVSGLVVDESGEPVSGQSVQLYSESARQRYTAKSDSKGEFWIEEVETSTDYMISVRPKESYRDYVLHDVDIGHAGEDLEVILEPLDRGSLTGQMLDPEGQPVPEFSLWLRNPESVNQPDLLVTGDQQGFFEVREVEEGPLVFETRSSPLYNISGLHLSARDPKDIQLVLDRGKHQVRGMVVDDMGRPVPATELFVTSLRHDNGLRTHAMRRAVTDASGYFIFNQVGPGYHTIRVEVPGFLTEVVDHVVGKDKPEVLIQLERASLHGM